MLIRRAGDRTWREPAGATYATEKDLENLVKESPEVIPGIPHGPAAVATQLHVPDTGPADVVVIDTEGGITVIECKLRANPEVRRWVIGQVFSYASGIALMSVDELDDLWRMRTGGAGIIASFAPALPDEVEESVLLARIAENLQTGRLRLVIAVDAMTEELKRTVTYINGHSGGTFELLALELEYIRDGDVEILVPTVYGEESAAHKATATRAAAAVSGRTALYQTFWAKYLERLHQSHPDWTTTSVPSTANWMSMRSPIKGTFFANSFSTGGKLRHELYIDTGDPGTTDAIYNSLLARKDDLQGAYGRPLQWEPLPNKRASRIADYIDAEVTQEDRHDAFDVLGPKDDATHGRGIRGDQLAHDGSVQGDLDAMVGAVTAAGLRLHQTKPWPATLPQHENEVDPALNLKDSKSGDDLDLPAVALITNGKVSCCF